MDGNSAYYTWVSADLPGFRGVWNGGSTAGMFVGHTGEYGMIFARNPSYLGPDGQPGPGEGFLEMPYAVVRQRKWFRWIRQDITCAGSVLWITDFKSEATRLEITMTSSDQFLIRDQFGGAGFGRFNASDLFNAPIYGFELDFVQR